MTDLQSDWSSLEGSSLMKTDPRLGKSVSLEGKIKMRWCLAEPGKVMVASDICTVDMQPRVGSGCSPFKSQ